MGLTVQQDGPMTAVMAAGTVVMARTPKSSFSQEERRALHSAHACALGTQSLPDACQSVGLVLGRGEGRKLRRGGLFRPDLAGTHTHCRTGAHEPPAVTDLVGQCDPMSLCVDAQRPSDSNRHLLQGDHFSLSCFAGILYASQKNIVSYFVT